ncbi:MAG TPA: hypothetical protein EYO51_04250 [Methylococcaceae bacterium]|jgi:hypothetical protein|nr:hypothetical protein [Methylococcaceae bacterium]HIA44409.1 hypothetical protein [Methylococcaceae bacterium]HIB62343.1 hypothetical protein [Methylococcaceae bacterium]HIN69059.1 hypothetical protein [Methylococcales bacterium]HIO44942.1 hypothetical protein [Methylococcales bacterium]
MSAEDNKKKLNEGKEQAVAVVKDVVAKVNTIRTGKPKIFYGAIVGVLVLYFVAFSGRNPEVISEGSVNNLKVGATYMLKSPNANGAENAKTAIVKEPCILTGWDRTENDDLSICQAVDGTQVNVLELKDAFGVANNCARVLIESGNCMSKEGWTLASNIIER